MALSTPCPLKRSSELLSRLYAIELRMDEGSEMPYSIEITYNALVPASSKETRVELEVALAKTALTEGEPTEARVLVANKTDEKLPTARHVHGPGEPRVSLLRGRAQDLGRRREGVHRPQAERGCIHSCVRHFKQSRTRLVSGT